MAGEARREIRQGAMQRELAKWARRRARIAELEAQGVSLVEIGRRYGISKQRVHAIVKQAREAGAENA